MRDERMVEGSRAPHDPHTSDIFERLHEKVYAWDRRTLAGYVDPYAEDVVLEGPFGILKGRKAAVDWAKYEQDWQAPYSERPSRRVLQIASMNAQNSQQVRYTTHELRWEQDGKPLRQTYSTMWRNNGGLWQIAHERISEVKPVTDGRPL